MIDYAALWLTLKLAGCTTLILLVICLPLAYWLSLSQGILRKIIETVVTLPLILPPTVLGFYLLCLMSPQSGSGRFIQQLSGISLPFTFWGILLGSVIFNLPFAMRPFLSAMESVERKYLEAAWCLGVSKTMTFFRVIIPLSWQGILVGILLPFAHTMGEFGVVLMLGGNIPGSTRTLSLVIYDQVQSLDYEAAHHTSLLLILISLVFVFTLQFLTSGKGKMS